MSETSTSTITNIADDIDAEDEINTNIAESETESEINTNIADDVNAEAEINTNIADDVDAETEINTNIADAEASTTKTKKTVKHAVRHKVLRPNLGGITKGDLRRLARRGGVKRLNNKVYDEAHTMLKDFITTIVHDAVIYTDFAKRKTVTVSDIRYALKRNGHTLYGF